MVPNGSAYDNYPSFANNGTKTPPGGSTESAKYALGMVPADTFPAEWANYLFHGATAGITRLNSDTGSIKKEINTVLSCKGITPDATVCDQLYCALLKIRDDAVALAYPVGTVYMNAKSATLPAAIQAIGTWCAIDGRFLRACASCIGCTSGNASVTLSSCHLPSHNHYYTPQGSVQHCHKLSSIAKFCGCSCRTEDNLNNGTVSNFVMGDSDIGSTTPNITISFATIQAPNGKDIRNLGSLCFKIQHGHTFTPVGSLSGSTDTETPTLTGTRTTTENTGCGTSFSILPPYRDVAMWYRDA